jgi:hypothetical protein
MDKCVALGCLTCASPWFAQCCLDPYPTLPAGRLHKRDAQYGPRGMCIRGGILVVARQTDRPVFIAVELIFSCSCFFASVSFVFVLFDYL